ncbi:MAG: L-seryl-tRNA(Sec) selenium transferase [Dehalococcoidia bacterium]|nr:L-seryl-tRNA(Sec) selenium transferase [Dehalococcoidia bacterium]
MSSSLRNLPSVDLLLSQELLLRLAQTYSHDAVVKIIRQQLDECRSAIAQGAAAPTLSELVDMISHRAAQAWQSRPQPVINATGVILHTNLGRAPLSPQAAQAAMAAATGYTDLEFELVKGERGSRQAHMRSLLCQVTGAEAVLVVNNNASAVMLGLAAIAYGKEVIVSRGEAVEIGGGFRIPDVLAQSGAKLVEVGTTNRTYVADYEAAITENTAALLKVHTSNFRVMGFTHTPETLELVEMGKRHNVPVLHDLGSGCLLETTQFGLAHEPTVQESIAAGCSLAFFSGDKLLGGPQAGVVVGQRELVARLERHPLARAMRIDKMSLAALGATLLHYLKGEAATAIPVWKMIAMTPEEMKRRTARWRRAIGLRASLVRGYSTIGGGSLPGETLPTWLLALDPDASTGGAEGLAQRLRQASIPVVARIEDDRVVLDPRTVLPDEEKALVKAVREAMA